MYKIKEFFSNLFWHIDNNIYRKYLYRIIDPFYFRIKEMPLLFKRKISFLYWLKLKTNVNTIVFDNEIIDYDNEFYIDYSSGNMILIGENKYKINVKGAINGMIINNFKPKSSYFKQGNELVECEVKNGKVVLIEQITLDLPKTQV
ncbi:MAG: hypothetical protein DRJ01_18495, partial [Bacteroidetes bacterium]